MLRVPAAAALRRSLLVLAFLAGLGAGLYLGAVVREGHAQSPEVAAALHAAAQEYGVSEAWMRRISWCESRFWPGAVSRGGHQGLFQFSPRTYAWMAEQAGLAGTSPFDPWSAARVAAWGLSHGYAGHWSCR